MCHINILIRSSLKDSEKVCGFLQSITTKSFDSNSHGDGVFYSGTNKVYKSENKLNYIEHLEDIKTSSIIISHQRLATSGKEEKYTHPFESDNFIMVHNGVVSAKAKESHSDTYIMFEEFNDTFNKSETKDRTKRIVQTIQVCGKEWDSGSYSIALYDKVDKAMYYFRNGCMIYCYEDKDYSFITTSSSNDDYLTMIQKEKATNYNLDSYTIYKYYVKPEGYCWANMGKIEKTYITPSYPTKTYYSAPSDEDELWLSESLGSCIYCKKNTSYLSPISYEHVCHECHKSYIGDFVHD